MLDSRNISLSFIRILVSLFAVNAMTLSLLAQDWMPIPHGQTSYFQDQRTGRVINERCDSVWTDSLGQHFGIYLKYLKEEFGECFEEMDLRSFTNADSSFLNVCSYLVRNDSIWIEGFWGIGLILPNVSESTIYPFNLNYNIECVSSSLEDVLGTQDSVKHYDLIEISSSTHVGNLKISKHYGIIEMSDMELLMHSGENRARKLNGIHSSNYDAGFQKPNQKEFVPYEIGDSLIFFESYGGPGIGDSWERYNLYIVTDVSVNESDPTRLSVKLEQHSWGPWWPIEFFPNTQYPTWDFEQINFNKPFEIAYRGDTNSNGAAPIYCASLYVGESKSIIQINKMGSTYDSTCIEAGLGGDYSNYWRYSDDLGYTEGVYDYFDGFEFEEGHSERLVYATPNNMVFGSNPLVVESNGVSNSSIQVLPNPVSNILYLSLTNDASNQVEIIDASGRLIDSKLISNFNGSIDISSLKDGIYFLKVSSNEGSEVRSFVKSSR